MEIHDFFTPKMGGVIHGPQYPKCVKWSNEFSRKMWGVKTITRTTPVVEFKTENLQLGGKGMLVLTHPNCGDFKFCFPYTHPIQAWKQHPAVYGTSMPAVATLVPDFADKWYAHGNFPTSSHQRGVGYVTSSNLPSV